MQYFVKTLRKGLQPAAGSKMEKLGMGLPEDGAEVS